MLDAAKFDTTARIAVAPRPHADDAPAERLSGPQATLLILGLSAFLWAVIFVALDAF